MKNLIKYLNESVYDNGMKQACKILNNIINNHSDDLDSVIYDLLDNISNNGEDDLILINIESWLRDKNK